MKNMPDIKNTFEASRYGDTLHPADRLKLEHHIYFQDDKTDISRLTVLPVERLQALRVESAAAEQAIFESLRGQADLWDNQAAVTLLIDKAIEYVKVPAAVHSSNQWVRDNVNSDRQSMSNMVYKMAYHINEKTSYDRAAQKSVPVGYELTWDIYTNNPGGRRFAKIAGQDRKSFADKSDMDKYLAGRIKAYAHLFTEISPPIPPEYKKGFSVNGQLLPGYTVQGEKPTDHAADMGGVSIVDQKLTELLKESEDMNEPLNIKLSAREQYDAGSVEGAWLKLPAAAEQLNAALARIGAQGKDFIISGIESPIAAGSKIPLENAQKAGIDELNFLAARLEMFGQEHVDKLNAASEIMDGRDDVHKLIEYTFCPQFYDFHSDIFNNVQLGEHTLEHSGLIQIPEEWEKAIDFEMLGQLAATHEKGVFTEYGYIVPSGAEWEAITEIPQDYRITPPDADRNATATRAAVATDAKPPAQVKSAPIIPIVLTAENPRDRIKEITDKLENGIKGIFNSDNYKNYLQTISKFHNYSFNNCILIAMQSPAATRVAGFNAWRDDFKRPVKKGEKGIKIFAPAPFKTQKEVDRTDANGKPVYENGKRVKDTVEVTVPAFKVVSVFDVSQTDGEPLPQIGVEDLTGNVDRYKEFLSALEKISPFPIGFDKLTDGSKGVCNYTDKRITINEGMSELDNLRVAIHEVTHSKLHIKDENAPKDTPRPDKETREVQAESIAYVVCQHYGLDISDSSFGYIAEWSGDKQLDVLKNSLDTIRREADAIITEIEKHFTVLAQDKEQTAERPAPEQTEPQGDTFTIYQLREGDETRSLRNETLAAVTAAGLAVALTNYDKTYTAPLDKDTTLDDIHFNFNMEHPEDFKGHSLSVSDVVVMNRDGKETAFYVDGVGFTELPDFLTPKEQAAELKGNALWQEYTALTERYPDDIVFKRIGDFYEVMGDKANIVANELGLVVTGRDVGLPERVPLTGIPVHHFDALVKGLVDKDFKITVAENDTIKQFSKPTQTVDLKIVADYMQKQYDYANAANPDSQTAVATVSIITRRLEQANARIPDNQSQLKALLSHAAQSPDLATLKERMNTMHSEFIQHYSTAVQNTVDMSGKAEPKAPAATVRQSEPAPAPKPPAQGENVAAIEAKVKAGETINLSDLSDAIKKDKAAQTAPTTGKTGTRTTPQGKGAAAKDEQPSIKEKIAAGRQEIAAKKPAPAKVPAQNKNAAIGG